MFIFCKTLFNYYPVIVMMIYKYSFSPLLLIIVIYIICVGKSEVLDWRNLCDIFKTGSNRFRLMTDDISSSKHFLWVKKYSSNYSGSTHTFSCIHWSKPKVNRFSKMFDFHWICFHGLTLKIANAIKSIINCVYILVCSEIKQKISI